MLLVRFVLSPPSRHVRGCRGESLTKSVKIAVQEGDFSEQRWQQYTEQALTASGNMTMTDTLRLMSSFASAKVRNFRLYDRLCARVHSLLPDSGSLPPKDLRRLAVSLGRARTFDSELMEAIADLIVDRVEEFRPRELVHIVEAYSRMPVQSLNLFAIVADALPSYVYDLSVPEVAKLCRAFGEAMVYSQELTDALCVEAHHRRHDFGTIECLGFLDGLSYLSELPADMKRNDTEIVAAFVTQISFKLLSGVDLTRLLGALVRLDYARVVQERLCGALLGKAEHLDDFASLVQLLHCLSLLIPSDTTKDLATVVCATMKQCGILRVRAVFDVSQAMVALQSLGLDGELLVLLEGIVCHQSSNPERHVDVLSLATGAELDEMKLAFACCSLETRAAVSDELERRVPK